MTKPIKPPYPRRATTDIARMFSGEMSPAETDRISAWRSAPPEYQDEFLDLTATVAELGALENDPDIIAALAAAKSTESDNPSDHLNNRWLTWTAAASVLVALIVGLNGWFGHPTVQSTDTDLARYVTRVGEQRTINLADGSTVMLNTGSEIVTNLNDAHRHIELIRGEAWFDVANDPERPFSVNLGSRTVTVLGTQFNILKTPEKLTVAVIEGMVAIHQREDTVSARAPLLETTEDAITRIKAPHQRRIKAGTVAEYLIDQNELLAYKAVNTDKLQDWRDGVLLFENVPLSAVIKELNRYSGKKILIEDAEIMGLKLYATFRVDRLEQALVVLEETLPIKVIRHFDRVVVRAE